jgi:hypothetical protein
MVQQFLYEEGLVNSPDLIGFNFDLKNPVTINRLNTDAATMVRQFAGNCLENSGGAEFRYDPEGIRAGGEGDE